MSFLDIKARSRRRIHAAFAVPCVLFRDPVSTNLTARLHDKMTVGGDLNGEGYASIIEGVIRAVFNREELATAGVTLARGDNITFPNYQGTGQDVVLVLDARDEYDGPITEKWSVGKP